MKARVRLLFALVILSTSNAFGQYADNKILLTVGGKDITAGEFTRMYKKSAVPGDDNTLDSYLDLFITFRQKVADALSKGMDTTRSFRDELSGYRKQLAQNYLTDPAVKDKIIREAYSRTLREVNASHILISCQPDAKPADTLKAYNRLMEIRKRVLAGEDFGKLAKENSDDPSAKVNEGNLGYFTAFQMIMPFENAAYKLSKGEVSGPVRTMYGYHLIKVNDTRPSPGKVRVAHIFIGVPQGSGENEFTRTKIKADSIWQRLKNGESFGTLASKYSDHRETASKGGELNWFGTGEIIKEIAEPSFALVSPGDFTEPVRSPFGWHIIKLLENRGPAGFDEMKQAIEGRIGEYQINAASRASFAEKLAKEYKYRLNAKNLDWFVKNTDSLILKGRSNYDRNKLPSSALFTFGKTSVSNEQFATYIEKNHGPNPAPGIRAFLAGKLGELKQETLIAYEDSKLEEKYPEFRYLINEFHDGILLFSISSENVWDKAQKDTTGQREYFTKVYKNESGKSFKDAREDIIPAYQEWLEKVWVEQLKQTYPVKVNKAVFEDIRKKINNEQKSDNNLDRGSDDLLQGRKKGN